MSKHGFQTEIEFELPKGYLDESGELHKRGTMRLATAADEILPLRDPRVQQNEAYLAVAEAKGDVQIVVPSQSILAEPPVAVVDKVVAKKGTRAIAEEYLRYLYTPEGQEIAAKNHYRPRDPKVLAKYENTFAKTTLFTLAELFGDWQKAQKTHFADRGVFDQIYRPK
jgi:sulfate transport system substrate-binding protein